MNKYARVKVKPYIHEKERSDKSANLFFEFQP